MKSFFSINNVVLGYQKNKPVLKIDKLSIPKNKMVFLLGKSGVGKSTILELLGLMNNTLINANEGSLSFQNGASNYDYADLWSSSEQTLSEFRNQYFSFIFQNENLMHNFTAGENICVTQMIQGKSYAEAKALALQLMNKLGIDQSKFNAPIAEFSGGQRQRLSFIRAISTNYKVLFCDEPTGNLDWDNARNLMQILKDDLIAKEASAVIVSHDISLALEFADYIYLLTEHKSNENNWGEITANNVIEKSQWENNLNEFKFTFEEKLK